MDSGIWVAERGREYSVCGVAIVSLQELHLESMGDLFSHVRP